MAEPGRQETPQLDELMMAMDVVDTIRHDRMALDRDLGQDDQDAALKARLRRLYEGQGLSVTDEILEEGIRALHESRFVYVPPKPSLQVTLAKLWVSRLRWGPWVGGAAGLLVVWVIWGMLQASPEDRLRAELARVAAQAEALAATDAAERTVAEARREIDAAIEAGLLEDARAGLARLEGRTEELALAFDLRIVNRPGEPTAVFRIPDANSQARNFYLLVEAVGAGGDVLARPITSEETGRTDTVTIWAIRVPEATYRMVGRDKQDDGIVQSNILGVKRSGHLSIDWRMPVMDGAITEWDQ
ncbi:MAG: DUF6384 family protein [Pikeienuella sp.]